MRKPYPSETQDRFMVRLPEGMREKIAEAAKAGNRTMNSEVVARLEATFAQGLVTLDSGFDLPSLAHGEERWEKLEARLSALLTALEAKA